MAREIGVYGKGGIGKSTIVSNTSAAIAEKGAKVMQIGCDPKADSTNSLLDGRYIPTILDTVLEADTVREFRSVDVSKVIFEGYRGIICAECGGPDPGIGCAGRGIITAIELMKEQGAFEKVNPDYVLYDVLGDVVCGGFAMPLRQGIAKQVYIVVSANFASLYAANNLCKAIVRFGERGGGKLAGLIANHISTPEEKEIVNEFAAMTKTEVIEYIPYSRELARSDLQGQTVIQSAPDSEIADVFRRLAAKIAEREQQIIPAPVQAPELRKWGQSCLERLQASGIKE
ncbi:MAG: AAA family ATPase [Chloroflexi bacterium]|nr:AAA family ATPase [Chloroflexota bacterium]